MDPIKTGAIFKIRDASVLRTTMPILKFSAVKIPYSNQENTYEKFDGSRLPWIPGKNLAFRKTR
jgi:hypothetical protein